MEWIKGSICALCGVIIGMICPASFRQLALCLAIALMLRFAVEATKE